MALQEQDLHEAGLTEDVERAQEELRSLGAAVGAITEELKELARRESVLAKTELAENAGAAARGAGWGAAAAVLALLLLMFVGFAILFALALVLPLWLSALITGAIFLVGAVICALIARRQFHQSSLLPQQTIRSLEEDVRWARGQIQRHTT